jgi:catechol 2,3-dioxygenase-like lactoylglutathione lyase family enzyme
MRTHISLDVKDVDRSVDFYAALLDAKPAKHYDDYALFITDDPAMELALDRAVKPEVGSNHFGLAVESPESVQTAHDRMGKAGFGVTKASQGVCCYARQHKFWTSDPEGRPWEVYFVAEETAEREDAARACC